MYKLWWNFIWSLEQFSLIQFWLGMNLDHPGRGEWQSSALMRHSSIHPSILWNLHNIHVGNSSKKQLWCTNIFIIVSSGSVSCAIFAWCLFAGRYRYAAAMSVSAAKPDAQSCSQLLETVGLKNWQIGHSKVLIVFLMHFCTFVTFSEVIYSSDQ